ncbi:MAG: alpha/beta hydrolase [Candidatus Levybacteria bacterium]|nr:alpha/beta hydrolase [Candidatus Levybacteria bacterium]
MKKRVFIVHRWDGHPKRDWYSWLKKELEKNNFEVYIPVMPHPEEPTIKDWVDCLYESVNKPDDKTYFVGHSVGCQTILRFLEKLPENIKVGGTVFVAGFFSTGESTLANLTDEEKEIISPWLNTSINLAKVKSHLPKSIAIFSDNDPYVPLDNKEIFEKELGTKTIIEHARGHFTDEDDVVKLPIVLNSLLKLSL